MSTSSPLTSTVSLDDKGNEDFRLLVGQNRSDGHDNSDSQSDRTSNTDDAGDVQLQPPTDVKIEAPPMPPTLKNILRLTSARDRRSIALL